MCFDEEEGALPSFFFLSTGVVTTDGRESFSFFFPFSPPPFLPFSSYLLKSYGGEEKKIIFF